MDYIKDSGIWKEVDTPYIKDSGIWKESDVQYMKIAGKWVDTSVLSCPPNDFDHIFLNHDSLTITAITDGYKIKSDGTGTTDQNSFLFMKNGFTSKSKVLQEFDFNVISGTPQYHGIGDFTFDSASSSNIKRDLVGSGKFSEKMTSSKDTGTNTSNYWNATSAWEVDITNISLRDVTTISCTTPLPPADMISYDGTVETRKYNRVLVNTLDPLTHEARIYSGLSSSIKTGGKITIPVPGSTASILVYDYNHGVFKEIVPTSSEYVLQHMTVGTIVYLDSTKFTTSDIHKFNAVPEKIVDWYNGIDVGISIVKGANDKVWLGGKEIGGGTALVKAGTIVESTISHKDMQLLKLKEDANGHYISSSTKIEGKDDGRYVRLPMTDTAKEIHLVKVCLSKIEGDTTQVVDTPCVPVAPADTPITGLQSGTTEVIAKSNSAALNAALSAGGTLKLRIPKNTGAAPIDFDGRTMTDYWVTWDKVDVMSDTTLTFEGGIMQHKDTPGDKQTGNVSRTLDCREANITLNNPLISQGGFVRTARPGTHAAFGIYGNTSIGNITINGGIIEGGASNNFQGGRNNTIFNDVHFRNSREHLIYANGVNGDGTNSDPSGTDASKNATGLKFNRCTMENPGVNFVAGQYPGGHESNHIQLRGFNNVLIKDCTVKGVHSSPDAQYGVLGSDIDGLLVENTTFAGNSHFVFMSNDKVVSKNWVFTDCSSTPSQKEYVCKNLSGHKIIFNNCTIKKPLSLYGESDFNSCTFVIGSYRMKAISGSKNLFNSCTFDIGTGTSARVFENAGDTSFTGTTVRVCPSDGRTVEWDMIPGSCP